MTNDAPHIAEIGKINTPNKNSGINFVPRTITNEAPSAAPAETPISPGSAKGFLNKPWRQAPDIPKLAPTKQASKTLGALISERILYSSSESSKFIKLIIGILKLPIAKLKIKQKTNKIRKENKII